MSGYVTVNRLSLVQLHAEERKQRAHQKKIAEMQRRGGINSSKPAHFPHVKNNFTYQQNYRSMEIARQNYATSKRLIEIMQSKGSYPAPSSTLPFQPSGSNQRSSAAPLSQNDHDQFDKASNGKGTSYAHDWQKSYDEHKEHLKISKNNKLFTPRDVGINRERIKKIPPATNSRRPTVVESTADTTYVINYKH